jgi:NAD(P)-dependent dehydrogenase (short-subunit alcohol dehydrogenase family)
MMSLDGKIAMVTGAATGIGAALAQALSSSGARVIGVDITWDGAEKMAGVEQAQCDVADRDCQESCVGPG